MHEGRVSYAKAPDRLALRFEGDIRYTLAYSLDHFLEREFAGDGPKGVCVDLNGATSIDSTGIGLLAKIAKLLSRKSGEKPVFFSTNEEINELLSAVCLDSYCLIVPGSAKTSAQEILPESFPEQEALAATILEAHKLLCELSGENRDRFQSVVDALERERE